MSNSLSTVDRIYFSIKERIITNELEPGQSLTESALAAEYAVSRTPIREAIKRLSQDDIIIILPKLGIQVAHISLRQVKDDFEIRMALEHLACKLIIKKAKDEEFASLAELNLQCRHGGSDPSSVQTDGDFHHKMWELAGNQSLLRHLESIHFHEQRWWHYMHKQNPRLQFFHNGPEGGTPFATLISALQARDESAALAAMDEHLNFYIDQIRSEII